MLRIFVFCCLLLAACAGQPKQQVTPNELLAKHPYLLTYREQGLASYYSDKLAGRKTASGAPYLPKQLTCAHRRLPFGTWLLVTHLKTGKQVFVKVTDRGPFVPGRIIDLSRAAAETIGLLREGIGGVEIRVLVP